MSGKSPKKLTETQIAKIKSMYLENKTINQIHKSLNVPQGVVRYHIERLLLAKINDPILAPIQVNPPTQAPLTVKEAYQKEVAPESPIDHQIDFYLKTIDELKQKNRMLLEIFTQH